MTKIKTIPRYSWECRVCGAKLPQTRIENNVTKCSHCEAKELPEYIRESISMLRTAVKDLQRGDRVDALDMIGMAQNKIRAGIAASRGEEDGDQ